MSAEREPSLLDAGALPHFPPLLRGRAVAAGGDPFEAALAAAAAGEDPGLVTWSDDPQNLRAAILLAPEVALAPALAMVLAAANALNDAVGALAPPEIGLTHVWPDGVKLNDALAGKIDAAASLDDPAAEPDWLVVGVALALRNPPGRDPGETPDRTALAEEGGGEVSHRALVESWSRHVLLWMNRWQEDGLRPLADAWFDRAADRGREVTFAWRGRRIGGRFLGLEEAGGMILQGEAGAETVPLSAILERRRSWPPEETS